MSATMIHPKMMLITAIQMITTSTKTIQTTTVSITLIQITILIMSSYVIIENSVRVVISFKNMLNIRRMLFNPFNNLVQISA